MDEKVYRFGSVEINLARGCVLLNAQEQPLRYQSFQVLVYLVEHRGRVVTKNELAEHVWQYASVTDNALVQCIAEIRRTLQDNPREPIYIRTVPKVGYRFAVESLSITGDSSSGPIDPSSAGFALQTGTPHGRQLGTAAAKDALRLQAQPERLAADALPIIDQESATETSAGLSLNQPRRRRVHTLWLLSACALIALTMLASFLAHRPSHTPASANSNPFPGKPLALTDFHDNTGQPQLAWLAEGFPAMLNADLAIAPGIVKAAANRIPVAQLTGNVALVGNRLRIRLAARDASGHLLAQESELAEQSELPLEAAIFSERLANRLGVEQSAAPSRREPPVTTSSPEAYRYYSLGVKKAQTFETVDAIQLLKKAIAFDPRFAMAYARIGYSYAVVDFSPEQGLPYLEHAQQLAAGELPESDQLLISAWTSIARRDYTQANHDLVSLTDRYPNVVEAWAQLARLLRSQERSPEAVTVLQRGLHANPDAPALYNVLAVIDLSLFRYPEAIAAAQHAITLNPEDPNLKDTLGMAYQQSGQYYAAIGIYTLALSADPEFEPAVVHLGDAYYQQGRYHDAVAEYQRYIAIVRSGNARALGYGDLATVYQAMGNLPRAREAAAAARRNNPQALADSPLLSTDRPALTTSSTELASLVKQGIPTQERGAPGDERTEAYYRGLVALQHGDRTKALAAFTDAVHRLPPTSAMDSHEDCLALAYLSFNMAPEAARELHRILNLNPNYPLAQYHLAQAYARMHDPAQAQHAYQLFVAAWKAADTPLPGPPATSTP